MKLQKFIDRPILSIVISVVILVAGLIGLYALSVEQYPDIAPPTIRVSTTYSGANAEAVQKSVIRTVGGSHQWGGKYDLHDLYRQQYRQCRNHRLLQAGQRPGYGGGQCAEQSIYRHLVITGRSDQSGCHYHEAAKQYAEDIRAL